MNSKEHMPTPAPLTRYTPDDLEKAMKLSNCAWKCWKTSRRDSPLNNPCSTCVAIALALAESRAEVDADRAAMFAQRDSLQRQINERDLTLAEVRRRVDELEAVNIDGSGRCLVCYEDHSHRDRCPIGALEALKQELL